jgi:hypothetical protein
MESMEISRRLERWVGRVFPQGSSERVLAELRGLPDTVTGGQDVERIQAALVIGTGGDWQAFQAMLRLAHTDWRDLLVNAELADGDWPARLDDVLGPRG